MKFQWDKEKAAANFRKHRVNFESVTEFDFTTAMIGPMIASSMARHASLLSA